mmetsp:Transcript_39881/g.100182  ORF Transcript_39881/g.100182 Transcript_39881/m.100182 type:complete len:102 (-) Transcript_39881:134-439(-)
MGILMATCERPCALKACPLFLRRHWLDCLHSSLAAWLARRSPDTGSLHSMRLVHGLEQAGDALAGSKALAPGVVAASQYCSPCPSQEQVVGTERQKPQDMD